MVLTIPVSVCTKQDNTRKAQKSDQRLSGRQVSKDHIKNFLSKIGGFLAVYTSIAHASNVVQTC